MRENMKYDTNKYQLRESVLKRMLQIISHQKYKGPAGTVFYGDSITEYFDLERFMPAIDHKYNCGIGGITSNMLLHFVDEGVLKYEPEQVFLMIGTNDLGNTLMLSPRDIALNVKELIEIIHYNLPHCKIHLLSCIPCIEDQHGYKSTKQGMRSNDILKMIFKEYKRMIPYEYVHFINVYPALCNKTIMLMVYILMMKDILLYLKQFKINYEKETYYNYINHKCFFYNWFGCFFKNERRVYTFNG